MPVSIVWIYTIRTIAVFTISVKIPTIIIEFGLSSLTESTAQPYRYAGLFKRTAALVYDALIVVAILFLASALAMLIVGLFLGAEAITEQKVLVENPFYFAWLIFCWFYYYYWCWQKGGQTLGMKAWRLKLVSTTDETIKLRYALLRFSSCLLGLANLWLLLPGNQGWQDILSHSIIIVTEK